MTSAYVNARQQAREWEQGYRLEEGRRWWRWSDGSTTSSAKLLLEHIQMLPVNRILHHVPPQVVAIHPDQPLCQPFCINKRVLWRAIYAQRSSPKDRSAIPTATTTTTAAAAAAAAVVACSKGKGRHLRWVERKACCSPVPSNWGYHEQTFVIVHSSPIVNPTPFDVEVRFMTSSITHASAYIGAQSMCEILPHTRRCRGAETDVQMWTRAPHEELCGASHCNTTKSILQQ